MSLNRKRYSIIKLTFWQKLTGRVKCSICKRKMKPLDWPYESGFECDHCNHIVWSKI